MSGLLSKKAQGGRSGKRSFTKEEDAIILAGIMRGWGRQETCDKIEEFVGTVRSVNALTYRKSLMIREDEKGLMGDLETREEEGKLKTEEDYREVIEEWRKRRELAGKKG